MMGKREKSLLDILTETCEETYELNPTLGTTRRHSKATNRKHSAIYRKRHPHMIKARIMNRRGKVVQATKETANDIEIIYKSQNGKCWWCGEKVSSDYHIDHRIPLTRGGTNDPSNLVISCKSCNLSKGKRLPHEWTDRLL